MRGGQLIFGVDGSIMILCTGSNKMDPIRFESLYHMQAYAYYLQHQDPPADPENDIHLDSYNEWYQKVIDEKYERIKAGTEEDDNDDFDHNLPVDKEFGKEDYMAFSSEAREYLGYFDDAVVEPTLCDKSEYSETDQDSDQDSNEDSDQDDYYDRHLVIDFDESDSDDDNATHYMSYSYSSCYNGSYSGATVSDINIFDNKKDALLHIFKTIIEDEDTVITEMICRPWLNKQYIKDSKKITSGHITERILLAFFTKYGSQLQPLDKLIDCSEDSWSYELCEPPPFVINLIKENKRLQELETKQLLLEKCDIVNASDFQDYDKHVKIIAKLVSYMRTVEDAATNNTRLFIDGEYDSNQTEFEAQSNLCRIGVSAKNTKVGHALLHLLRIHIDNNYFLMEAFLDDKEQDSFTVSELFEILAEKETEYTTVYEKGARVKDVNGRAVKRSSIDVWTLDRISAAFSN